MQCQEKVIYCMIRTAIVKIGHGPIIMIGLMVLVNIIIILSTILAYKTLLNQPSPSLSMVV